MVDGPPEVDEALSASREAIWTSQPPWPEGADALLQRYIGDRRHLVGPLLPAPRPTWESILGVIQAARGSAPGVDGIPYE
eukprot:4637950-Alexandrium_andersonii.AAC.1